jgi:hypothetical protein
MCYYDLTRWKCGFWRWGQFREHCQVYSPELDACTQRSMMIWQTHEDQEDCKLCKSIEKKQRKTERLGDAIGLWQQGNDEQSAEAIEKAQQEIVEAANAICALQERHSIEIFGLWKGNRDVTNVADDDTSTRQPENKDEVATSEARQDNTTIRCML